MSKSHATRLIVGTIFFLQPKDRWNYMTKSTLLAICIIIWTMCDIIWNFFILNICSRNDTITDLTNVDMIWSQRLTSCRNDHLEFLGWFFAFVQYFHNFRNFVTFIRFDKTIWKIFSLKGKASRENDSWKREFIVFTIIFILPLKFMLFVLVFQFYFIIFYLIKILHTTMM